MVEDTAINKAWRPPMDGGRQCNKKAWRPPADGRRQCNKEGVEVAGRR